MNVYMKERRCTSLEQGRLRHTCNKLELFVDFPLLTLGCCAFCFTCYLTDCLVLYSSTRPLPGPTFVWGQVLWREKRRTAFVVGYRRQGLSVGCPGKREHQHSNGSPRFETRLSRIFGRHCQGNERPSGDCRTSDRKDDRRWQ